MRLILGTKSWPKIVVALLAYQQCCATSIGLEIACMYGADNRTYMVQQSQHNSSMNRVIMSCNHFLARCKVATFTLTRGYALRLFASEVKSTMQCLYLSPRPFRMPSCVGSGNGGNCSWPDLAPHMNTLHASKLLAYRLSMENIKIARYPLVKPKLSATRLLHEPFCVCDACAMPLHEPALMCAAM